MPGGSHFDFCLNLPNRPDVTNIHGEPWETAVTEFELFCGLDWFNAFLTSMGLFGLFLGAFVAGMYTDKFGRKNAILVWQTVCAVLLVAHGTISDKYAFMVFRTLGNGANVSKIFHKYLLSTPKLL